MKGTWQRWKRGMCVCLSVLIINTTIYVPQGECSWFSDFMGGLFTVLVEPIRWIAPHNPTLRKNNPFVKKAWEEEAEKEERFYRRERFDDYKIGRDNKESDTQSTNEEEEGEKKEKAEAEENTSDESKCHCSNTILKQVEEILKSDGPLFRSWDECIHTNDVKRFFILNSRKGYLYLRSVFFSDPFEVLRKEKKYWDKKNNFATETILRQYIGLTQTCLTAKLDIIGNLANIEDPYYANWREEALSSGITEECINDYLKTLEMVEDTKIDPIFFKTTQVAIYWRNLPLENSELLIKISWRANTTRCVKLLIYHYYSQYDLYRVDPIYKYMEYDLLFGPTGKIGKTREIRTTVSAIEGFKCKPSTWFEDVNLSNLDDRMR